MSVVIRREQLWMCRGENKSLIESEVELEACGGGGMRDAGLMPHAVQQGGAAAGDDDPVSCLFHLGSIQGSSIKFNTHNALRTHVVHATDIQSSLLNDHRHALGRSILQQELEILGPLAMQKIGINILIPPPSFAPIIRRGA